MVSRSIAKLSELATALGEGGAKLADNTAISQNTSLWINNLRRRIKIPNSPSPRIYDTINTIKL